METDFEKTRETITDVTAKIVVQTIMGKINPSRCLNELDRIALSLEMKRSANEDEYERSMLAILIEFVSRMYMYMWERSSKQVTRH